MKAPINQQKIFTNEQENILSRPTNQLLNDFGAGKASPGSGSAAALLGLLSSKMIHTVCSISLTKQECYEHHTQFKFISKQVEENIVPKLKELFEKDAKDFEKVVNLRIARDKSTNRTEKSNYSRQSLDLLQIATDYTFEVANTALTLMEYGVRIFNNGWHAIRGDSGVSISAAMSAVMSSIFIINLNLKTLKRRKYAKENFKKVQELQTKLDNLQTKAFSCVSLISHESLDSIQLELRSDKNN
ncbi:cyclodeaminase/cyclohydrolase family protein [uncultured Tenacibaculum sp.]|uniref:cyclodeaminase/cyclohydrolase family protein n=1 Tax=uncultured Tenacibaculum sp. TaxID=174713 RepID=UPI002608537E|nr:cyclodeaminase/cyclohydrolase family protein [uncultured Tenacibaculum sp.]